MYYDSYQLQLMHAYCFKGALSHNPCYGQSACNVLKNMPTLQESITDDSPNNANRWLIYMYRVANNQILAYYIIKRRVLDHLIHECCWGIIFPDACQ